MQFGLQQFPSMQDLFNYTYDPERNQTQPPLSATKLTSIYCTILRKHLVHKI